MSVVHGGNGDQVTTIHDLSEMKIKSELLEPYPQEGCGATERLISCCIKQRGAQTRRQLLILVCTTGLWCLCKHNGPGVAAGRCPVGRRLFSASCNLP